MKKVDTKRSPFFARFLEGQPFPQVKTELKAGATKPAFDLNHTMKYPSDGDEGDPS